MEAREMKKVKRRSSWADIPLGNILTLEYGKSFPEKRRKSGPYAVYGSNGKVGRAHDYLVEEPTIVVGRKGSAGEINWAEEKSWPIDTAYYVNIKDGRVPREGRGSCGSGLLQKRIVKALVLDR